MTHSFEHNGIHITDSSMDESGRFEVNPIEYYGAKAFSDLDDLREAYENYCKQEKLECIDALDYLLKASKCTTKQYEWIKNFCVVWDMVESKE